MNYITSTELRTKTSEVMRTLQNGGSIRLIHKSKVIGEITPTPSPVKPFDSEKFLLALKGLKPKKLIPRKDRDKIYRKHLEEKLSQTKN